jgi:DNA-binding response OmpR family regulator
VAGEQILVIEDDAAIATNLVRALATEGFEATIAATGAAGLDDALTGRFDLVLLDLGLPDVDGLDVCRRIRDADDLLPVIVLTARREEIDIVVGLDAGAVDYVTKPFRLAELLARIRAQLRRAGNPSATEQMQLDDLVIDTAARRVARAGCEVPLRPKELDLLVALAMNAGRAVTREWLMTEVWDAHWFGSTKTLDVHLASLRRKLGERQDGRPRITTLRNVGYRYESP